MDIKSTPLRAYRYYVESLEGKDDFDQWLLHGDYMELLSTRASLADALEAETLNEREKQLLAELDDRMADVLTTDEVEQLQQESEELPVKDWWR